MKTRVQIFPPLSMDDLIIHASVLTGASIGIGVFIGVATGLLAALHTSLAMLALALILSIPSLMLPALFVIWARATVVDLHSDKGLWWAIGSIIGFVTVTTFIAPFMILVLPLCFIGWMVGSKVRDLKSLGNTFARRFNISSLRLPAH